METALAAAKSLADGNRMRIAAALMRHEELCVCQIVEMLGLAPPTVSRHISILQNAGLVQSRKHGRWVYYRLAKSFPELLRRWLLESLKNSQQIRKDEKALEKILSCDPEELCRKQKERNKCDT